MTRAPLLAIAAFAAFGAATASAAPISVTTTNNANTLATALVGTGVTLNGASYTGAAGASGTFTGGLSAGLGFDTGIVLTTGAAAGAGTAFNPTPIVGFEGTPYTPPNTENGAAGTALIANSFDASALTLTFTSSTVAASFSYVFASGEYPGFVGSDFNDAFRLILNGVDIATLPGTGTQVSINTVNDGSNSSFFVDNQTGANGSFPYGGRTTTLSAGVTGLTPGAANTLTLVIADVSDRLLDSAVFVQAGSLTNAPPVTTPPTTAVPEPATLALLGAGLGVLALRRRR